MKIRTRALFAVAILTSLATADTVRHIPIQGNACHIALAGTFRILDVRLE